MTASRARSHGLLQSGRSIEVQSGLQREVFFTSAKLQSKRSPMPTKQNKRRKKQSASVRGRKARTGKPAQVQSRKVHPSPLAEGLARCVNNAAMEQDLEIGQVVYLREIPNMQGHCVVLRNGKPPLVGYHLDRFELLGKDGD